MSVGEGHHVIRKKVQRLSQEQDLQVPPRRHKRRRVGHSTTPADRLSAARPDHVWAIDYQFDVTSMGKTIKFLHVSDEYTRQSLSDRVAYSIDGDATVAELDRIIEQRGRHPEFIRMDNGPELAAFALRDWCRFAEAGTSYIDPGSPWKNPRVESYGSRMRDEVLAIEQPDSLLETQVLVADWERGVQHTPTTLSARHAHACRVLRAVVEQSATPHIAVGPITGVRSCR
jgi:putative transposase